MKYQSVTGEKPTWRWPSPHAFASDCDRWHVRAFCHARGEFRDFVLGPIIVTRHVKPSEVDPTLDRDWNTTVDVIVTPNPNLEAGQRVAIAAEYKLSPRTLDLELELREAMLFYVEAKFGEAMSAPFTVHAGVWIETRSR